MKTTLVTAIMAAILLTAGAADNPTFIKGDMQIQYRTRTEVDAAGKPNAGVTDLYTMKLNVSGSVLFAGEIQHTPTLFREYIGTEKQGAKLDYKIDVSIINPNKADDVRGVGRLIGTVPIDKAGVYRFNDGTLRFGVHATGKARDLNAPFRGLAHGRPPKTAASLMSKVKKEAIKLTREVRGKSMTVVVSEYDKMLFSGHELAMGPVQSYPSAQVNGEMLYDYERSAWYFRGVSISYKGDDAKVITDKLTGNIRWLPSPQYKVNGEGEYQFDVRVNEPEAKTTEADVFAAATDEAAFFASNDSLPALVGKMKYKDSLAGETVTSSSIAVDLHGNKLNRQQVMNLCKLILISSVVPINSE